MLFRCLNNSRLKYQSIFMQPKNLERITFEPFYLPICFNNNSSNNSPNIKILFILTATYKFSISSINYQLIKSRHNKTKYY